MDEQETPRRRWSGRAEHPQDVAYVETGRGQVAEVAVGVPFADTMEELAEQAHYGKYFRVFLNGEELVDPADAPDVVQAGMRIAITSYDKVGLIW